MEEPAYAEMYVQEDVHWWFRGRRALIWALLHRAQLPDKPRILDAGCGTGRNLAEFGVLGVAEGVDSSKDAVEFCTRRGLDAVRTARIDSLPFDAREFDLLFACDVLEHLEDDAGALRELHRVAAVGAYLVITVPAYRWLWTDHDVQLHHLRRYTLGRLLPLARSAGWDVVHSTYYNSILLPAIALARLLTPPRSREGRTDLDRTPASLNGLLELPMRFEAAFVRHGGRFPAGASVALLCRKPAFST